MGDCPYFNAKNYDINAEIDNNLCYYYKYGCTDKEANNYDLIADIDDGSCEYEENENELDAAYRELEEETAITKQDITLKHLMNFNYKLSEMELEVYVGKLNKEVDLVEEVNKLYWINKNENFFDVEKFAGEGNIGHMLKQAEIYKDALL